MKRLPRLVCQHNKVELCRAHKDVCEQNHGKEAWVDVHGCYNFVVCQDCREVLKAAPTKEVYYKL